MGAKTTWGTIAGIVLGCMIGELVGTYWVTVITLPLAIYLIDFKLNR